MINLFLVLLSFIITPFSPLGGIRNLEDAFESCDIDTSAIESILVSANGQTMVEVPMDSVFTMEVIDTLDPDAEGSFPDIPEGAILSNFGLIVWRGDDPADWSSFGVAKNDELGRYWLILFPTNIFVVDSFSCGAFELRLSTDEDADA